MHTVWEFKGGIIHVSERVLEEHGQDFLKRVDNPHKNGEERNSTDTMKRAAI